MIGSAPGQEIRRGTSSRRDDKYDAASTGDDAQANRNDRDLRILDQVHHAEVIARNHHHDAGGGADDYGFSRLPALDGEGVIAATVAASSARIGDARSAWESGIISHANALALAAGIAPGDEVPTFADKAIATRRGG